MSISKVLFVVGAVCVLISMAAVPDVLLPLGLALGLLGAAIHPA